MCKKLHVLGLENEEYSPQMCKLYLKWSKFSCNLSAWGRIETICMEMTLKRKKTDSKFRALFFTLVPL